MKKTAVSKIKKLRLVVVDDHFVVRVGLVASLQKENDMKVVAEASSAEEGLELYQKHRPDVLVMDWRLPGANGAEATAVLRARQPDARVLIISAHDTEEDIHMAVKAGALGYVHKHAPREELLAAVRSVARGEEHFNGVIATRLAQHARREPLTDREREVLALVQRGLSNKEIGARIHTAESTVKFHLSQILVKMKAQDRTHAVTLALQRGILHLD
jgi:DNA-binding NarL/FixJ family response regulator